jgi:hypothetical protein
MEKFGEACVCPTCLDCLVRTDGRICIYVYMCTCPFRWWLNWQLDSLDVDMIVVQISLLGELGAMLAILRRKVVVDAVVPSCMHDLHILKRGTRGSSA